jgi:hypothetical protein
MAGTEPTRPLYKTTRNGGPLRPVGLGAPNAGRIG